MEPSVEYIVSLKEEVKKAALANVLTKFPEKVKELNDILNDERFAHSFDVSKDGLHISWPDPKDDQTSDTLSESSEQNSDDCTPEKSTKTQKVVVPSNHYLVEMVALLKPQFIEFIQYSIELSAAINLLLPPIEDGNNFGVEIQQECIDTTINAENDVYQRLQDIHKYFSGRAELAAKAAKNTNCEDFRIAIQERDRAFHRYMVLSLTTVRNFYMSIHDLVLKNMSKIKKPKSRVSTEMLY